jgi:hypothetical protein
MSAQQAQIPRKTRQQGPNPGKYQQILGGRLKTGVKGAQQVRSVSKDRGVSVGKGKAGKFKKPRSTRPVQPDSPGTAVEHSPVTASSSDRQEDSAPTSLYNPPPPPVEKQTEHVQGLSTQAITDYNEDSEVSEGDLDLDSDSQLSPDVEGSVQSSGSEISSQGGIWGTRPQLDKDNMTHQTIAEIVQKTFGLDSLTPLISTVQNILETDEKYTAKKWTGTQPKVRRVWL